MRLEAHEIAAIRDAARAIFGGTAAVRVFGSPINDHVRGGDPDLFLEVEPGQATSANEAAFRDRIGGPLDELRVDVVFHERGQPLSPIHEIALRDGVAL